MRMRWIGAATGLVLLALLPACGGDSSSDEINGGGVHSVGGVLGGTVDDVPDHPQRIVSLWSTGTQLFELGVEPVGVLQDELTEDNLSSEDWRAVQQIPTIGTFDNLDIEKILSLEPDLVVGLTNGFMTEKDLEPFHEVGVPVLIWEVAEPPDVWTNYPELAKALGQSTDYERRDAELTDALSTLGDDFADKVGGTTWANVRGTEDPGSYYIDTDQSLMSDRLSAAGLRYPGSVSNLGAKARYTEERSYEQIPELQSADAIFYEADPDGSPTATTSDLLDQELWKQLPAVKSGNAFPLRQQFNYTFAGAQQQVEDFRSAFEQFTPAE